MTKLLKDVAVVIPVFNEEKLIGECIDEWLNVLDSVNLNYEILIIDDGCLLYTSPSPRDRTRSRMPSSA